MVTLLGSILENALCKVEVPIGGVTIDPISGNPYPNTKTYEVYLYLKDGLKPPRQYAESQPRDVPMVWVEGWVTRVVDPTAPNVIFPAAIPDTNLTRLPCEIDNNKAGSLYLIDRYANAAVSRYVSQEVLGEQVWGWFNEEQYDVDN